MSDGVSTLKTKQTKTGKGIDNPTKDDANSIGLSSSPGFNMHRGYIKIWRKTRDWAFSGNCKAISLWMVILTEATHKTIRKEFKGKIIDLSPGQFITGRKYLGSLAGISENSVERYLKLFENEKQIQQQTSQKNRIITILNWDKYQGIDNGLHSTLHNRKTTERQQKDTYKNDKNDKNNNKKRRHRDSVFLTDKEFSDLTVRFGRTSADSLVENLDNYIGSRGDKYKSHYKTLLAWAKKDKLKPSIRETAKAFPPLPARPDVTNNQSKEISKLVKGLVKKCEAK